MKYLILLVIVLAVVVWFKRRKKFFMALLEQARTGQAARKQEEQQHHVEAMVQCRQCHIHFPSSEAVRNLAGDVFCCEEHKRLSS